MEETTKDRDKFIFVTLLKKTVDVSKGFLNPTIAGKRKEEVKDRRGCYSPISSSDDDEEMEEEGDGYGGKDP